tara:strand:+ start:1417 stop:1587 length:171 start_codon:yes stop_codon:yes gene_type:complete
MEYNFPLPPSLPPWASTHCSFSLYFLTWVKKESEENVIIYRSYLIDLYNVNAVLYY